MTAKLFETALGIAEPWSVASVDFDEATKVLTISIDFLPGSRFAVSGHEGVHPVHDNSWHRYGAEQSNGWRLKALRCCGDDRTVNSAGARARAQA